MWCWGAENPVQEDGTTNRLQFSESTRLLEWGFNNFTTKTLLDSTYFAGTIPVTLSRTPTASAPRPPGPWKPCCPMT